MPRSSRMSAPLRLAAGCIVLLAVAAVAVSSTSDSDRNSNAALPGNVDKELCGPSESIHTGKQCCNNNSTNCNCNCIPVLDYHLDPSIVKDPVLLREVSHSLQQGKLVILHDAFRPEFAEYVWGALVKSTNNSTNNSELNWQHVSHYNPNGINSLNHQLDHDNQQHKEEKANKNEEDKVKMPASFTNNLEAVLEMFNNKQTQSFILCDILSYICDDDMDSESLSVSSSSTAKWYRPEDYSSPRSTASTTHVSTTDTTTLNNHKTVISLIWDLSKDWKSEYAGIFYWHDADRLNAYTDPRFNSLYIFTSESPSLHSITPVSNTSKPHHRRFLWTTTITVQYPDKQPAPRSIGFEVVKKQAERFETENNAPITRLRTGVYKIKLQSSSSSSIQATVAASYDGTATSSTAQSTTNLEEDPESCQSTPVSTLDLDQILSSNESSVVDYLNPHLFDDPAILQNATRYLQADGLFVLQNAFTDEFAEYSYHRSLANPECNWTLQKVTQNDDTGYTSFKKWDPECPEDGRQAFRNVWNVFNHPQSKDFFSQLTGRNAHGSMVGRGGKYEVGEYSDPHSDHKNARSVTFLWNLSSKGWKAKWAGRLCGVLQVRQKRTSIRPSTRSSYFRSAVNQFTA